MVTVLNQHEVDTALQLVKNFTAEQKLLKASVDRQVYLLGRLGQIIGGEGDVCEPDSPIGNGPLNLVQNATGNLLNSVRNSAVERAAQQPVQRVPQRVQQTPKKLAWAGGEEKDETKREDVIKYLEGRKQITFKSKLTAKWKELSHRCQEPPRAGCLAWLLSTPYFQLASIGVIMLNAITTSIGADVDMRSRGLEKDSTADALELACLFFYTFELAAKFIVHRFFLFWNDEMAWSIFDLALLGQGWIDIILVQIGGNSGGGLGFVRLTRLLKMSKIFRIFRMVKFLKDLRAMLMSVVSSLAAMFWAFILLATVLFMSAMIFVQLQGTFLIEERLKGTIHLVPTEEIDAMFGSVRVGMLTLFLATTGGVDWLEVYNVLSHGKGISSIVLVGFIFFWNFSMLNVVTGIVMEKAVRHAQPDRDAQMLQQRQHEEQTIKEIRKIFKDMDLDDSETLTMIEFTECLKDEEIADYFSTIGLSINDAEYFFSFLMEATGTNEVSSEEFIKHCVRMKGQAMAIDLIELAWEVKGIKKILSQMPALAQGSESNPVEAQ